MVSRHFLISHGVTDENEGFYTPGTGVTKDDPGGETIYGLTRAAEPKSGVWPILDAWKKKPGSRLGGFLA